MDINKIIIVTSLRYWFKNTIVCCAYVLLSDVSHPKIVLLASTIIHVTITIMILKETPNVARFAKRVHHFKITSILVHKPM